MRWLDIDERTDVLISPSLCNIAISNLKKYTALWKWGILSLHSTLQGEMACHLSGTAQLGALSSKCAEAWIEWHARDAGGEIKRVKNGKDEFGLPQMRIAKKKDFPPTQYLANPEVLFERLYDSNKRYEGGCGSILDITNEEKASFSHLNRFRNEFTHFTPKGWSIEVSGLPQIFIKNIDVFEKILSDPWPFRHMQKTKYNQLKIATNKLRRQMNKFPTV